MLSNRATRHGIAQTRNRSVRFILSRYSTKCVTDHVVPVHCLVGTPGHGTTTANCVGPARVAWLTRRSTNIFQPSNHSMLENRSKWRGEGDSNWALKWAALPPRHLNIKHCWILGKYCFISTNSKWAVLCHPLGWGRCPNMTSSLVPHFCRTFFYVLWAGPWDTGFLDSTNRSCQPRLGQVSWHEARPKHGPKLNRLCQPKVHHRSCFSCGASSSSRHSRPSNKIKIFIIFEVLEWMKWRSYEGQWEYKGYYLWPSMLFRENAYEWLTDVFLFRVSFYS